MLQEICERVNGNCVAGSRLRLKFDPTIEQDKYISKITEGKKEDNPSSSSSSGSKSDPGGAPVGSTGCSWWSACVVKSST